VGMMVDESQEAMECKGENSMFLYAVLCLDSFMLCVDRMWAPDVA
jgi:hypothetical protein